MSATEDLLAMNAQLESWLRRAGGQGSGVLSLARSLTPPLPSNAERAARQFARIKNRVSHEAYRPSPEDMIRVEAAFDLLERALSARLTALAPVPAAGAPALPPAPAARPCCCCGRCHAAPPPPSAAALPPAQNTEAEEPFRLGCFGWAFLLFALWVLGNLAVLVFRFFKNGGFVYG